MFLSTRREWERFFVASYKRCNFTGIVMWYFHRAWFTCGTTTAFLLFPSTSATFLLFFLHQHRYSYIFIVFPPLPPLLPHFYWFPTTATITKFVLFSLHCHHHTTITTTFPSFSPPSQKLISIGLLPPTLPPLSYFFHHHIISQLFSLQHHSYHHISIIVFPPLPPLLPHLYGFPSTTTTAFPLGFPPPRPPPLPQLYCFSSKHISKVPKKFGASTYFSKSCFFLLLEHNTFDGLIVDFQQVATKRNRTCILHPWSTC